MLVGLGNPGPEYARTRHNLGFRVVDALAEVKGVRFRRDFDGLWAQSSLYLLKPLTYMNLSGTSVAAACRSKRLHPGEILVACDDLDLPLGKLRLRREGGTGGHRGLASIRDSLGTGNFGRLRLGIGRPPEGEDAASYVLAPFPKDEEAQVNQMVERAAALVDTLLGQGWEAAMNHIAELVGGGPK